MKAFVTAAAFGAALMSTGAADAASLDLAARGLVQGGILFSDAGAAFFTEADPSLQFGGATSGVLFDSFDMIGFSLFAGLPGVDIDGLSIDAAFDADSVLALIELDSGAGFVLAELLPPRAGGFDFTADFDLDATLNVYEVAAIPPPAAAPLLLAGLGALALIRRRA